MDFLVNLEPIEGVTEIQLDRSFSVIHNKLVWMYVIIFGDPIPPKVGIIETADLKAIAEQLPDFIAMKKDIHVSRVDEWGDRSRIGQGVKQTTTTQIINGRIMEYDDHEKYYHLEIFDILIDNANEDTLQTFLKSINLFIQASEFTDSDEEFHRVTDAYKKYNPDCYWRKN